MPRVAGGRHLALDAAVAEASRHHDPGDALQLRGIALVEGLRLDPADVDPDVVPDAGMTQGLGDAQVGVGQLDVLADHGHGDDAARAGDAVDGVRQRFEVGLRGQLEVPGEDPAQAGLLEHQRHPVDGVRVGDRDHRLAGDVAEERDLLDDLVADRRLGAADDGVGLDADAAECLDRVLGGLGLHLLAADQRDQGQVHVEDVLAAEVVLQLPDRFQEGQRLDVADGPPHLHHDHLGLRLAGDPLDALLDLVGDVGDDLHRRAQVVAAPLLGDHLGVDLAGGHVGGRRHVLVDEALVVAEVEVGFRPVVGDEHLTVLVGAHGARVDVEVRVELLDGDGDPAGLEDAADRGGGDPLAERRNHTAGYEDVFRQLQPPGGFSKVTSPGGGCQSGLRLHQEDLGLALAGA